MAGLRVLVADDGTDEHDPLVSWLQTHKVEVMRVRSGTQCIDEVNSGGVLAAVIDADLSDASGYETLIRARSARPRLPLVFITNHHAPEIEIKARQAGILYYGVKPLDYEALILVMSQLLQERTKAECRPSTAEQ